MNWTPLGRAQANGEGVRQFVDLDVFIKCAGRCCCCCCCCSEFMYVFLLLPWGMVLNGNIVRFAIDVGSFYFCCLRKYKIWLKGEKKKVKQQKALWFLFFLKPAAGFRFVFFDWCNGDNLVKKRKKKWQKNNRATKRQRGRRFNLLSEASVNICETCRRRSRAHALLTLCDSRPLDGAATTAQMSHCYVEKKMASFLFSLFFNCLSHIQHFHW